MTDVINRLRASKEEFANEAYQSGHEFGQLWAQDTAEFKELSRLEEWRNRIGTDWHEWWRNNDPGDTGYWHFVSAMSDEDEVELDEAKTFWVHRGIIEEQPDNDFVLGFTEGALSVWDGVKHQL